MYEGIETRAVCCYTPQNPVEAADEGTARQVSIETKALRRTFKGKSGKGQGDKPGERVALDGVDLSVTRGEVRGLLGPNGAGKTTLVKVLSTVLLPSSGTASVCGLDVVAHTSEVRRKIGVVFGGERGLYGRLSARQNLDYWASMYRLDRGVRSRRVEELLERFGLAEHADLPVDRTSRGMKQRIHLARGLLSSPELLFLDEPTIGMDPVAAREFHTLFAELRGGETTILLTTHDMAEAELLCDQVTLIDRGSVLGTESPSRIGEWISAYERIEARIDSPALRAALADLAEVGEISDLPDGWCRISTESGPAVSTVLKYLVDNGVTLLRVDKPNLQEVYLRVIGDRGLRV